MNFSCLLSQSMRRSLPQSGPENGHTLSKADSPIPSLRISAEYVHLQRVTSQKITRNYIAFLLVISLSRRWLFLYPRLFLYPDEGGIHISSKDFRVSLRVPAKNHARVWIPRSVSGLQKKTLRFVISRKRSFVGNRFLKEVARDRKILTAVMYFRVAHSPCAWH